MFSRKADRFSRVVAFITAFAIAMLTVTLVHRTIISAEEAHPDISESNDIYGESMPSDTGDDPVVTEIPGDIYGDDIIDVTVTDNGFTEEIPGIFDGDGVSADDSGIELYANSGNIEITPEKTEYTVVKGNIFKVANCKIYKDGGDELLSKDEKVKNGDKLEFDFSWELDDDIFDENGNRVGFDDKVLKYEITNDDIKGITLNTGVFSWWVDGVVRAVYEIKQEGGNTYILIEPRVGFEPDSKDRKGELHLYGSVDLSGFNAGDKDVTLEFFDANVKVTTPDLDNSITVSKSTEYQPPEKRVENGVTKYYQKFKITLRNDGIHDATEVIALDSPGGVFTGVPQNPIVYYSYDWNNKTSLTITENSPPYTFKVDNIKGNGEEAYIEYEMEVNAEKALNPSLDDSALENKVTVTSNPNDKQSEAEAKIDLSTIRPSVDKSGVVDKDNNKIVWTITVHSNGMGDKNFTVKDIIDNDPANTENWSNIGDGFEYKGDGVWVKEYKTDIPANVTNNQVFKNKVEVTYPTNGYVCENEASVTYQYDDEFVKKDCTGLDANGNIGWTTTIDVPQHLGAGVKSIEIKDQEVDGDKTKYGGKPVNANLFKFDADGMTITVDGKTVPASTVGSFDDNDYWNGYKGGYTFTIDNENFLKDIVGKTITLSYKTSLVDTYIDPNTYTAQPTDIELLGLATNSVDVTVNYTTNDSLPHSDTAEYRAEFVVRKETGYTEGEVPANTLREPLYWLVTFTDFSNVQEDNTITFTDTLLNGYTFLLNDSVTTNPEYYVKCELYNNWWAADQTVNNAVYSFNDDHTVMNGTITLTKGQADKLANEGYFIRMVYFTQMTEDYYAQFNSMDKPQSFTNTIEATVNGVTRDSEWSQIRTPKNENVLNKTSSGEKNNDTVTYTLNVNKNGVHLGSDNADVITLKDTLGKYLSYNDGSLTITPQLAGDTWSYDENTRQLVFTLQNEQKYTISYTAKVISNLNRTEYRETDGVDNDTRDLEIINMLFGNTAELSYDGGDPVKTSELISSGIYRSDVSIQSKLLNNDIDGEEKMCLKIKKVWNDKDNPNKDPITGKIDHDETVKVIIDKYDHNGKLINKGGDFPISINRYNDANGTYNDNEYYNIINDLPIYDKDRNPYEYRVTDENGLPLNYTWETTTMEEATDSKDIILKNGQPLKTYVITVTNTYVDSNDKIKLTVKKDWKGDENDKSERDASVMITVKRDGKYFRTVELNDGNKWEDTLDNLPKYSDKENDKEYEYTVSEVTGNPFYKSSVTKSEPDGDGNITFTVTNDYLDKTKITVNKIWDDNNNKLSLRNRFISFTLKQGTEDFEIGNLSESNNWTQTIEVPKYSDAEHNEQYEYSVEEVTGNLYYKSEITSTDNADGSKTIDITNTYIPRKQVEITIIKKWEGENGYTDMRSDSIDFTIKQNGGDYDTVTLTNASADEASTTIKVPMYRDAAQTEKYNYTIIENANNKNYTTTQPVVSTSDNETKMTVEVTNTFDPTDITITKIWDDGEDESNRKEVEVTLYQDKDTKIGTYPLNKDNGWTHTVNNLPKYDKAGNLYAYAIEEETMIDGYSITDITDPNKDNGYLASVTNSLDTSTNTEQIKIKVTKQWSGGNDNSRKNITVILYRKGSENVERELVGTYPINKSDYTGDIWVYEIPEQLDKYDDKNVPYEYTVEEVSVDGYDTEVTRNPSSKNGYNAVISNKYKAPEEISITVTKNWDDGDHRSERRDVTMKLLRNGEEFGKSYTFNAIINIENDSWTHTFSKLPKNDANGNAFTYTVVEVPIEGYTPTPNEAGEENNWSITNKYDEPDPNDPNNPGPNDPNKPGPNDPNKPGPNDPNNPDLNDPNKPGPNDPNKPDQEDPNKPDQENPNKPSPEDPNKPTPGTKPSYPPSGATPVSPTVTKPKEPDRHEEPEDVSSEAGFFDEEFDAVRRDDMMILILAGIIVTGTLILAFRHRSDKSDGKYHM